MAAPNGSAAMTARGPAAQVKARPLAVARLGYAYVAGASPGPGGNQDFAIVKYGPLGLQKWVRRFNGKANGDDAANSVAFGRTGVYVAGFSRGFLSRLDYLTIKYRYDGKRLWARRYNSPNNGRDMAMRVAVDGADNVYVSGESGADYATIKYDSAGRRLWVKRYNRPANQFDSGQGLAVDPAGNVHVKGMSRG